MAEPVNMQYINDITSALSSLATTLFIRGKVNLTDAHAMSEGFYEGLLNLMYDLNLHNTNSDQQNAEGIDLNTQQSLLCINRVLGARPL